MRKKTKKVAKRPAVSKRTMDLFKKVAFLSERVKDVLQYIEEEADNYNPELLDDRTDFDVLDAMDKKSIIAEAASEAEQFLDCIIFECETMVKDAKKLLERLYKLNV